MEGRTDGLILRSVMGDGSTCDHNFLILKNELGVCLVHVWDDPDIIIKL